MCKMYIPCVSVCRYVPVGAVALRGLKGVSDSLGWSYSWL